jgi:hypothetical protein
MKNESEDAMTLDQMTLAEFRASRKTGTPDEAPFRHMAQECVDLNPRIKFIHVYDTPRGAAVILEQHMWKGDEVQFFWSWLHPRERSETTLEAAERELFTWMLAEFAA